MGWVERKAEALIDKTIGKWIWDEKFFLVSNSLDLDEREKIVRVTKTVMEKVIYITTFISITLITFYLLRKLGAEKLIIFLVMLSFIQLVYINKNLSAFMEKKP